ncbi:MAG: 6-phosphogluconolactonase [Gammaproteobacteria bacterium]|nr:6-phosphogluconolactonase [Gammaproteobacteria bacterium]
MSTEPSSPMIRVATDTEATVAATAARIADILTLAARQRGRATMALAGGNTPRRLYEVLAGPPYATAIPWPAVHLFLGDERCVPPDHADSNQRMVRESLLAALPEAPVFHPMPAEWTDLEAAAAEYARVLSREAPGPDAGLPQLDIALLGMGPDGHTASLFPGTPILDETRPVAAVHVPRLDAWRLSLTLPVFNATRHVLFLVTGAGKAEMLARILDEGPDSRWPASLVAPAAGEVEWHVDSEAAALLGDIRSRSR